MNRYYLPDTLIDQGKLASQILSRAAVDGLGGALKPSLQVIDQALGWPAGTTWDNADGTHDNNGKRIIVAELK